MKLKPGCHLIVVCNDKGGGSKSNAAAEVRTTCAMEEIPSRLVTFDGSNETLKQVFRNKGVHVLAKPDGDVLLCSFGAQIDDARKNGEIIIADMPPQITDTDNRVLRAFSDSRIFEEFDSIGLIIPIFPHVDHVEGACKALAAYDQVPIKYDRGLVRAWRPELTSPAWDTFSAYRTLAKRFPIWDCNSYLQSLSDMMQGRAPFADYPGLDELPSLFAEKGATLSTQERGQLRAAVAHLENAREAIRTHLLIPLQESTKTKTTHATA